MSQSNTQRTGADELREIWAERPVRPRLGRKLGGVGAALGRRYGVDPVLVRVLFVASIFVGGVGLVLYGLGWLLLPEETEPAEGQAPGRRNTSTPVAVVLLILLLPAIVGMLHSFSGIMGFLCAVGVLYLLHRNYRDRGTTDLGTPTASAASSPGTGDNAGEDTSARTEPIETSSAGQAEYAAPPAEPPATARPTGPPEPKRYWITLGTLALAALALLSALVPGMWPSRAIALSLFVLGVGMIVGSFLRRGRTLVLVAIPVALLAMLANAITLDGPWRGGGRLLVRPATAESVQPMYSHSLGKVDLDLRDLRLAPDQTVRTGVDLSTGHAKVRVPRDADVTATCSAQQGYLDCLGGSRHGRGIDSSAVDTGPDGPGAGRIVLDLRVGTGAAEVTRE